MPPPHPFFNSYCHTQYSYNTKVLIRKNCWFGRGNICFKKLSLCIFYFKKCFLQQQHNLWMEQLMWPFCWLLKSLFYIKLTPEGCISQCCYDHQPFVLRRSIGLIWSLVNHQFTLSEISNVFQFTYLKNYKPQHTLFINQINQLLSI